jgi:hypothetical protein
MDPAEVDPPPDAGDPVASTEFGPPGGQSVAQSAAGESSARARLISAIAVFTVLRFGLLALLTLILMLVVPFIIALAIAIVLQLPIAMLVFTRQRHAVNAALAASRSIRRTERAELRAALRGQDD